MRLLLALCLLGACSSTPADVPPDGTADGAAPPDLFDPEAAERARLTELVKRYGPILYHHPAERYLPSSTDWFLQRASLFQGDKVIAAGPAPASLPASGDGYYLTLPSSARGGDLGSTVAYVHSKGAASAPGTTELQFWFFYPYNGPGTLRVSPPIGSSTDVDLAPFGEHTGDWEHFTLRIDNASSALTAIYLSQHAGGEWIMDPLKSMELEGGRPVVYSSKNGHAIYRAAAMNLSETGSTAGTSWGLRNDTAKGPRLDTAAAFRLVRSDEAPLTFAGRWGPRIDNASFITDVVAKIPLIGSAIANSTLASERISDGPTSPATKSSWAGEE